PLPGVSFVHEHNVGASRVVAFGRLMDNKIQRLGIHVTRASLRLHPSHRLATRLTVCSSSPQRLSRRVLLTLFKTKPQKIASRKGVFPSLPMQRPQMLHYYTACRLDPTPFPLPTPQGSNIP
ncbi:unnamed protein product, partial [Ectocarpus fasciculatus]